MRGFVLIVLLAVQVMIPASGLSEQLIKAGGSSDLVYFYDDLGQLVKVIDSHGTVVEYAYDNTGNLQEFRRTPFNGIVILGFSPQEGPIDATVAIQGQNFGTTPSANSVRFNGTAATVLSASSSSLVVTIPPGATSGPITVTAGGQTATSSQPFTVAASPVISNIAPILATSDAASTVDATVQITGSNLQGSTFIYLPVFNPPALSVSSASVDPGGSSATLSVSIAAGTAGSFSLVATNGDGSSSAFPSPTNTITVLEAAADPDRDGLTNAQEIAAGTDPFRADTDGDGFMDSIEVGAGSNPLDPLRVPVTSAYAEVSVFNQLDPSQGNGILIGSPVSVLNRTDLGALPSFAVGTPVSVFNSTDLGALTSLVVGAPVSAFNATAPAGYANCPEVSVENHPNP